MPRKPLPRAKCATEGCERLGGPILKICKRCDGAKYRQNNRQEIRARYRVWRDKNRVKVLKWGVRYRNERQDKEAVKALRAQPKHLAKQVEYREINRLQIRQKVRAWQRANPEKFQAMLQRRKDRIERATPKWADKAAIATFWARCPSHLSVDHVVPLAGKIVCGLNVIENLQYIDKPEQSFKSNKFPYIGPPPYPPKQ